MPDNWWDADPLAGGAAVAEPPSQVKEENWWDSDPLAAAAQAKPDSRHQYYVPPGGDPAVVAEKIRQAAKAAKKKLPPGVYDASGPVPSVEYGPFTPGAVGGGMLQAGMDIASVIGRVVPLGVSGDDLQHTSQNLDVERQAAGEGWLEGKVRGATRSLMPMVLTARAKIPGLPAATAPIAAGSAIQGSQSLTEARDQGLSEGEALKFAAQSAAVEAVSEALFSRFLPTAEKVISGGAKPTIKTLRGFVGEMAKTATSEYGQEAATEYMHSANEWLSDVNLGEHEWTPEGWMTLLSRMNDAGVQGAMLGGGLGAANAGISVAERGNRLEDVKAERAARQEYRANSPPVQPVLDDMQTYFSNEQTDPWLEPERQQQQQAARESAQRVQAAEARAPQQAADAATLDQFFRDRMGQDVEPADDSAGVRQLPIQPDVQIPDLSAPPIEQPRSKLAPPQLPPPISEILDPNADKQRWTDREAKLQAMTVPQLSKQADAYGLPKSWNKDKIVQWIVTEEKRLAAEQPTQTEPPQEAAAPIVETPVEVAPVVEVPVVEPTPIPKKQRGKKSKTPALVSRDAQVKELARLNQLIEDETEFGDEYNSNAAKAQLLEAELRKGKATDTSTAAEVAQPGPVQVLGYGASPRQPKPKTPPPASAPVMQKVLYGKGFIGADVVPTVQQAAATMAEAASQIQSTFAPQTRGGEARTMKGLAREHGAVLQRRRDVANKAFETASKLFAGRSVDDNYDFIDRMERGAAQDNHELDAIATNVRKLLDERRAEVQALGTGKLEQFIQDYFPHIWEQPDKAQQAFAAILGKRPLEGPKSFLKQRKIDTFSEGIAAGLVPVSHNPVDLALLKAFEMDRYILGQRLLSDMREKGLAKYVPAGTQPEDGLTAIDDKIATVYGAPTIPVSEHVNKSLWDALNAVAANLGVKHSRKPTVGGGALGKSFQGGNEVQTRANTDLSVLAHEISHQLDHKYDLQSHFLKGRSKDFHDQIRKLADMHESKQKYFRKRAEKMATLLEAYVRLGPDGLQNEAPAVATAFSDFLNKVPAMQPLLKMRQTLAFEKLTTEVPHGGLLIRGRWYAPDAAANVINNYLSPGLRSKSGVFRAYLGVANVMNQFQLGWSAFHLGFTSMDAATSKLALAIEQVAAGKPGEAAKSAALGATGAAAFTNAIRGDKLLKEWITPGSQGSDIARLVDGLVKAGGRVKQDEFYRTHMVENAMQAFRDGNIVGGIIRLPFALTDAASKPIMEWIVPRQKLGVFADLAELEFENLGPNASEDAVREAMAKAWDSADNRMGQVVYDNLFWNKAAKEVAMASVRSLGWNLGTFRELGGGAGDWLKAGVDVARLKKPELTHRMAYTIAMPALAGVIGGILHYLMTGSPPEEMKDWFYPKTGKKDETGHDIRLSLPSYMKDVYAYAKHPFVTLGHKMHPAIAATIEMLNNKDFYGTKIRNEDDPLVRQAIDVAEHTAGQFVPFAVRGQQQIRKGDGGIGESLLPFIGITPAPASITRSEAEQLAGDLLRQKMPVGSRTKEQSLKAQAKSQASRSLAGGKMSKEEVQKEAEAAGVQFNDDDWKAIEKRSKASTIEYAIGHLDANEAMKVWNAATQQEREHIENLVAEKIANSEKLSDADKHRFSKEVGPKAEIVYRNQQLHEATTLAKHVLTTRPVSLTSKEKSEGKTIQQKREDWQAKKDDAKKRLIESTLDREAVLQEFEDKVLADMKDPVAKGHKLRTLRKELGWQKQLGKTAP